jgi:hypothetical protein
VVEQPPVTIVCGVNSQTTRDELAALLDQGAGEIFAGYVPPAWLSGLGLELSPNRRYELDRQLHDPADLRRVGRTVRDAGARFVIALNEHVYPPRARALLPGLVAEALDAGANGFIVADPSLLAEPGLLPADGDRIASCEAGAYNVESARAWVEWGATRLILPRETRLDEAWTLLAALSDSGIGFEAFAAREYCLHSSAVCLVTHGYGQRTHFCCAAQSEDLLDLSAGTRQPLPRPLPDGHGTPAFFAALGALQRCGFCALGPLIGAGVRWLKLPGRGSSALPALRLLRRLLDGGDLDPARCRGLVGSPDFCASAEHCYYRPRRLLLQEPSGSVAERDSNAPEVRTAPLDPVRTVAELAIYLSAGPELGHELELLSRGPAALVEQTAAEATGELAAARRAIDVLAALGVSVEAPTGRVYLGFECCALRWPSGAELEQRLAEVEGAGFAVTVVTPTVYQALWLPLLETLEHALGPGGAGRELVISDWGLLRVAAARQWPVARVAGRLLARSKRDVYAIDPDLLPACGAEGDLPRTAREAQRALQQEQYGWPPLSSSFWRTELRRAGVSRLEHDLLPTPLTAPLPPEFAHSLLAPWCYLAARRSCRLAATVEGQHSHWPTERCGRPCERFALEPHYPWRHRRVLTRGAALFLDLSAELRSFWHSAMPRFDRIVFAPRVPR